MMMMITSPLAFNAAPALAPARSQSAVQMASPAESLKCAEAPSTAGLAYFSEPLDLWPGLFF